MPSMLTPDGLRAVIDALNLNPEQRAIFMEFARGTGLVDDRVFFAMHQLALKTTRPVIRDRLMEMHELSPRQAYRIIDQALEMRRLCHGNGTSLS